MITNNTRKCLNNNLMNVIDIGKSSVFVYKQQRISRMFIQIMYKIGYSISRFNFCLSGEFGFSSRKKIEKYKDRSNISKRNRNSI